MKPASPQRGMQHVSSRRIDVPPTVNARRDAQLVAEVLGSWGRSASILPHTAPTRRGNHEMVAPTPRRGKPRNVRNSSRER
jgi:hypothetical protein